MLRANTGYHDGEYDLPAGHLDGGEPGTVATAREAAEELGITVDPTKLIFVVLTHGLFSDEKEYYNITFQAHDWAGEPKIMEPDKCHGLDWFSLDNLPANITPNTKRILDARRENIPYVEYGFDGHPA